MQNQNKISFWVESNQLHKIWCLQAFLRLSELSGCLMKNLINDQVYNKDDR